MVQRGAVEDLGCGDPDELLGSDWYSRYHDKDFFNQQYNSSYIGKYWCQVINTTADPDQPLMRSNVFTLLAPEDYTQPTCANQRTAIQTVKNVTYVLIKDFFNQQYNSSYIGKYWCQVITTADPDQPLMRSNVFTLLNIF